jgi:hypothetical protein
VGGAGAIIFGLANWLGKVWADRLMQRETAAHSRELEKLRNSLVLESESHKVKLKKSEVFFAKELEATSAFISLYRSILPRHHMPNMDWHDACDAIAEKFDKIEIALDDFLATHGAAIQDDVVAILVGCLGIAGDHKFEIDGPEVPASANKAAGQLYEELKAAERKMLKHVRDQART